MKHDPHHNHNLQRPLVTVERQLETDIATGKTQSRMFVKMYFDARDSGLLAAIPGELWKMLCCLATYMDENGNCSPSQERIGRDLSLSRQRVNERIQALRNFRFQGKPVLVVSRPRQETVAGGRWGQNQYQVSPIAGVGIFGGPKAPGETQRKGESGEPYVRNSGHRPMSGFTGPVVPDMNKSQRNNQNTRVEAKVSLEGEAQAQELLAYFHVLLGHEETRPSTRKEISQALTLIQGHGMETAKGIVAYAVREAESTSFKMVYFGAVLAYAEAALAEVGRRQGEAEAEAIQTARSAYDRFRSQVISEARMALSASELALLETEALSRAPEGIRKIGRVGGWVRIATDDAIAQRSEIPDFETWLSRARPTARATTTPDRKQAA